MNTLKHHRIVGALLSLALVVSACASSGETRAETDDVSEGTAAVTTTNADANEGSNDDSVDEEPASTAAGENQESHFDPEKDLDFDQGDVAAIALDGATATADSDDVVIDGSTVTITAEGAYSLNGTLADGEIIVDAADADDVILILDGVDIANADGAAIAVMNSDETVIVLAEGSTNQLADGTDYVFPDAETDEPNAALYSASDLAIAGEGELIVAGNYNDGIASKDGLVIESGAITVAAVDDGIRGKDYAIFGQANVNVVSGGDAIKADNDEDAERGYVRIDGGDITLVAGDDGVQAATDIIVTDGALRVDAGADSGTGRALQGDVLVAISGGTIDGTAVDDAIHSNDTVTIDGGTLTLAAGDDGIHGDLAVTINSGSIAITESYEGLEAEVITINDGTISVTSSDDGLNVASAESAAVTDAASAEPGQDAAVPEVRAGRPERGDGGGGGGRAAEVVGEHYIYINGGTITITITGDLAEQGDGIDANGHVEMTGGLVVVSGPTDTRNSAIDYSGGSFVLTGGTFIGTNVDGRNSEGIGTGSTQASLYVTSGTVASAGTVVHIQDSSGEGLVTFEPVNDYSVIVFSSPDLADGETYDVYLGGAVTGDSATSLYDDSAYSGGELTGTAVASMSA